MARERTARTQDPELKAMRAIANALEPLTESTRRRVLEYVIARELGAERYELPPRSADQLEILGGGPDN